MITIRLEQNQFEALLAVNMIAPAIAAAVAARTGEAVSSEELQEGLIPVLKALRGLHTNFVDDEEWEAVPELAVLKDTVAAGGDLPEIDLTGLIGNVGGIAGQITTLIEAIKGLTDGTRPGGDGGGVPAPG